MRPSLCEPGSGLKLPMSRAIGSGVASPPSTVYATRKSAKPLCAPAQTYRGMSSMYGSFYAAPNTARTPEPMTPASSRPVAHPLSPAERKQPMSEPLQIATSVSEPAAGYTGHRFAYRVVAGEESESMATRVARRRREAVERRFMSSPFHAHLADAAHLPAPQRLPPARPIGWAAFPPQGL